MPTKTTIDFCHSIFDLENVNSKVLVNLLLSLASNENAKSVVGLSESPLFEHHYSSISQAVSNFGATYLNNDFEKALQELWLSYFLR